MLIGTNTKMPVCYYRDDKAHLINTVRNWKCFKSKNRNIINFYSRCIGDLSQIENLKELKEIVKAICMICNSEIESENCLQKRNN